MKSLVAFVVSGFLSVGAVLAAESGEGPTLSAKQIQELCFSRAGIPDDAPGHRITIEEYNEVLACSADFLNRQKQ